jgi:hypothetical protein
MDPCSVDDTMVPDYTAEVVETMELLELKLIQIAKLWRNISCHQLNLHPVCI